VQASLRLVLVLTLTAGWCVGCGGGRADGTQQLELANAAVAALNAEEAGFVSSFQRAMPDLALAMATSPARAGDKLAGLRPLLDHHLAALDRAITASDAYLAVQADPTIAANLEKIRRKRRAMAAGRERLAALATSAANGASAEQLQRDMAAFTTAMMTAR
jgi:hypothetical protein